MPRFTHPILSRKRPDDSRFAFLTEKMCNMVQRAGDSTGTEQV